MKYILIYSNEYTFIYRNDNFLPYCYLRVSFRNLNLLKKIDLCEYPISNEWVLRARGWLVAWTKADRQAKCYETKCDGMAAGTLTSRPMFKLWVCRRRGPCASDQKRMRCVHQAAGTVFQAAQYTIVSSSFARARPKPPFSVTPTAFISHHAPHHGQAGSFLSAQGSVHACTWILREIKGNRFAHSKKRERFPKFTGR